MGRGGGHSCGHGSSGGHMHYGGGGRTGRSSSSFHGRSYHSCGRVTYYRGQSGVGGLISSILIIVLLLAVFMVTHRGNITRSTHERTKLSSEYCELSPTWFEDELDWIHDEGKLMKGLRKFYDETGVQPLLYITDNIDGKARPNSTDFDRALRAKYYDEFNDEGHVIVCFLESSPSDYASYYYAGAKAKNVLDDEGAEILLDYLDYYYTEDMDDEDFFATSFSKAADRMMSVQSTTKQLTLKVVIIFILVGGFVGVTFFMYKRQKKRAEQAKADAAILNTPIKEED